MLKMYLNDHDHGILIERFHYNYLLRDSDSRAQVELSLSDQINEDVALLSELANDEVNHVVIKNDDKILYDVAKIFVIDSLSDIIEDGARHTTLALVAQ